jgi:hypothetical protein
LHCRARSAEPADGALYDGCIHIVDGRRRLWTAEKTREVGDVKGLCDNPNSAVRFNDEVDAVAGFDPQVISNIFRDRCLPFGRNRRHIPYSSTFYLL